MPGGRRWGSTVGGECRLGVGKVPVGGRWLLGAIRAHDDGRGCCLLGADVEVEVDTAWLEWL